MAMTGADSEMRGAPAAAEPAVALCLHGPLRKLAGGSAQLELPGETVIDVLRALEARYPEIRGWILDERGRIRRHINVFVGGERGQEQTSVRPGDRVEVLPAITGG
jgi:molybdopterin converting factor small subunit